MKINTLQDLYIEELRDMYDVERQLVSVLPKIVRAAQSDELRLHIEDHLEQTKEQVERLDEIFNSLGVVAKGQKCKAMEVLIEECNQVLDKKIAENVFDAALIAALQRVEHYEIAAYGTLKTFAKLLEREDDVDLLDQSLDEEKDADGDMTGIAESTINTGGGTDD